MPFVTAILGAVGISAVGTLGIIGKAIIGIPVSRTITRVKAPE